MKFGEPAPMELDEWTLAERFGWTLEYIGSLTLKQRRELAAIDKGRSVAYG